MKFGERLKQLREEKKLTQQQLGNIINVSKPSISRYEKGINEPDNNTLIFLAEFFNVSIDFLLCHTDIKNPYQPDKKDEKDLDPETAELLEKISSLSEESKEDLKKQIELLKIRDSMDKAKNETLSTSEKQG